MKIFCFKAPKFLSFFLKPFVKKQEEEEKKQREQEARERRMAAKNQRGPIQSSIPVRQQDTQPVQMPSQSSADAARIGDAAMADLEDLFEEGL